MVKSKVPVSLRTRVMINMKKKIALLTVSVFLLSVVLGALFIIPVGASEATIKGLVLYNERPLTEYSTKTPEFWVRNETSGQGIPSEEMIVSYNNNTAEYAIILSGPGKYGIQIYVDAAEPFDGGAFVGDFRGWNEVEVKDETIINLPVCRILHLTSPKDNKELQHWTPPYDTYFYDVVFTWDALPEATQYRINIDLYQDNPYSFIRRIYDSYWTSNTEFRPSLPPNEKNQHYEFDLYAYNLESVWVGYMMTNYISGYGWDYRFKMGSLITGIVYDGVTSERVVGATVVANGYENTTGSDGSFKLIVPTGNYTLTVSKEKYVTYTTSVTVEPGETESVKVLLEPFATITGFVTNEKTGDPIEGATVEADGTVNTTGSDGSYSLSVEAGKYEVSVFKDGYYTYTTSVMVDQGEILPLNITLKESHGTITGYITDAETGDPIEGATVATNITANGIQTTTGSDGSYSLSLIPGTYNLTANKNLYFDNTTLVTVNLGETRTVNFTLLKMTFILGFVTDEETGDYLVDAYVTANGAETTTNTIGKYLFLVTPGTYTLTVSMDKYLENTTSVEVLYGDIKNVNFTIIKYGIINGTVYDIDTGDPVEGATVTANPTAITLPDGTYSLKVRPGTYTLTVSKGGYVIMSTSVTAGSGETQTIDFTVPKLATITGTITDYKTGNPLDGVTVTAGSTSDTTGSDGAYSLSVDPDTYSLIVSKSGYVTNNTSVTVSSGETRNLNVALREPKGTITGIVQDENGDPIAGATVTANGEQTTTGSDGSFTLNIDGGTYTLTVRKGGYVKETYQVTVGSGGTQTQNAILATPAGLPLLPIVAAVGGIGAVAAVVLLMKMRKPKEVLKATRLGIRVDPTELLSDGKSTSTITIDLLDSEGNLIKALEDSEVRLETTLGKITSPITIPRGEATGEATLTSSTDIGEVTVSAESWNLRPASTILTFIAVLRITADTTELRADGKSTATITIELLNGAGELTKAVEDTEVRLSTTMGTITSPVTILKDESTGKATLTSAREFGKVTVSAEGKGLRSTSIGLEFVERKRYCMHCGTRMALDINLCPKCGRAPPSGVDVKACPNCGEVIPTVAKFCSACGASQPEETQEND